MRYAAIQFVVLTACAMCAYAGGTWGDRATERYQFTGNFLSDLGTTHALSGRANYLSCALFVVAIVTVGGALVAWAWAWRGFAFARGRARGFGIASQIAGTASGVSFIGIGCAPWDLALAAHNALVVAAFGLLLIYAACLTITKWRNGVSATRTAVNLAYLAIVVGYIALVLVGPSFGTDDGLRAQVIGQKTVVYASMIHIIYLATTIRRSLVSGT